MFRIGHNNYSKYLPIRTCLCVYIYYIFIQFKDMQPWGQRYICNPTTHNATCLHVHDYGSWVVHVLTGSPAVSSVGDPSNFSCRAVASTGTLSRKEIQKQQSIEVKVPIATAWVISSWCKNEKSSIHYVWVSLFGAKASCTSDLARWIQMLGILRMGSSMCTRRCTSPLSLWRSIILCLHIYVHVHA